MSEKHSAALQTLIYEAESAVQSRKKNSATNLITPPSVRNLVLLKRRLFA